MAVAISLTASDCANSVYSKMQASTLTFRNYYYKLTESAIAVNPVERLVFSLILADTKTRQAEKSTKPF